MTLRITIAWRWLDAGQRAVERPPARIVAGMLASAVSGPPRGGLGIGEKVLVDEQVLVRERGERFAHLQDRPQQQPFGFLAVVVKRGFRIGKAGEPRAKRVEVLIGGNLGAPCH